ncbi:MAG: hypothetical protein R6X20_11040 [Phycisphaerae bacterium]
MRGAAHPRRHRALARTVCLAAVLALWAPPPSAADGPDDVPGMVLDPSAPRWVIDRFAGNSTAGPSFLQGPARQAGGLGKPAVEPAPDGSVFLGAGMEKWRKDKIVRVSPAGTLRLVAGGGWNLGDGPAREARIAVNHRGGGLVHNRADGTVYFVHPTVPAVRRLLRRDGEWYVETAAGDPTEAGHADGPCAEARFDAPRSLAITSAGTVYVLDGTHVLRKIADGRVTTLARFRGSQKIVDGPLDEATLAVTNMSGQIALGENDHTLYVADHWHFAVRKIDLEKRTISTVVLSENRPGHKGTRPRHADGPALTDASFISGIAFVCWDPVHRALWVGGPDENRLRWLRDGRVWTVLPTRRRRWPEDALGVDPADAFFCWVHVRAVDRGGQAYIVASSSPTGVWRARDRGTAP